MIAEYYYQTRFWRSQSHILWWGLIGNDKLWDWSGNKKMPWIVDGAHHIHFLKKIETPILVIRTRTGRVIKAVFKMPSTHFEGYILWNWSFWNLFPLSEGMMFLWLIRRKRLLQKKIMQDPAVAEPWENKSSHHFNQKKEKKEIKLVSVVHRHWKCRWRTGFDVNSKVKTIVVGGYVSYIGWNCTIP